MAQCSERVWFDSWRTSQCQRKATVERDGKWYCKIHDPEYIKAKHTKRETKYQSECCGHEGCNYHFDNTYFVYCPFCGTWRAKRNKEG